MPDDLPPALSSMWRLCKLGYRHEPRPALGRVLPRPARRASRCAARRCGSSCWAKACSRATRASCTRRPLLIGVSAAATWFLRTVSTRVQRGFRDKVTIALESHVARLQASVATIAHQERPDYLDRLSVLRNQVFVLDHMYMSLFSTCGWILRLGVTVALLMSIHPALVLLAAVRACRRCSRRRGGRRSSAPPRNAAPRSAAWPVTCSPRPPRRRPAKRCA